MPYKPRLLWHMDRFHWGGGGLQQIERNIFVSDGTGPALAAPSAYFSVLQGSPPKKHGVSGEYLDWTKEQNHTRTQVAAHKFSVAQTPIFRVPQKEVDKRSSITCFHSWSLLATFSGAPVTFRHFFCQTRCAGLLLRQGEIFRYGRKSSYLCLRSHWNSFILKVQVRYFRQLSKALGFLGDVSWHVPEFSYHSVLVGIKSIPEGSFVLRGCCPNWA